MSESETSTERVGYFNARNGVFFQKDQGTYAFTIRNEGVDTSVAQTSWNQRHLTAGDTILNASKNQIFWCDLEWLGLGMVTCGFVIGRELITCHQFEHVNTGTGTYMKQAKLPFRYEITETEATASTLKQVCATSMSEGGYDLRGYSRCAGNDSLTSIGTTGGKTWPLAIRLSPNHIDDVIVVPSALSLIVQSNSAQQGARFDVVVNPTINSATWQDVSNSTGVQVAYYPTMTDNNNGININTIYVESRGTQQLSSKDNFNLQLGRSINSTSDILAIRATSLKNNPECAVSLTWYEI